MATSEQLEHDAEATRARIAATLEELRGRMTPGQMVDRLVDYTRDSGGGEFVRNFGRQVAGNPIPVTLVGAGLAWLMMAGRRGPAVSFGVDDVAERMSKAGGGKAPEAGRGLRGSVHDAAARLNQRAGEAGADLQDTMTAAGDQVRDAAAAAYDSASATYGAAAERSRQGADAFARGARSIGESAAASGQNVLGFLQDQPLVLAGLGLALGAMLGGVLPITDTEDQLMGDASDAARRDAKGFAEEQVDKGKDMAEQAWNAVKPAIDEQVQSRAERSEGSGTGQQPTGAATLVPSDHQTGEAEATGDGARHDTGHAS